MAGTGFIAHPGFDGNTDQSVAEHLLGVAELSRRAAAKVGMGEAGELLGLLHDFGKYSARFQSYLRSASGQINPDEDGYVNADELKGKIDHSSAGAQFVWRALSKRDQKARLVGQMLALCVASHHSGLIDCVNPKDEDGSQCSFERRMSKAEENTYLSEATANADRDIRARIEHIVKDDRVVREVCEHLSGIVASDVKSFGGRAQNVTTSFQFGLAVKYLFSCLIDADRVDTADFERQRAARHRQHGSYLSWGTLIERLESKLKEFDSSNPVAAARHEVSEACAARAVGATGLYTLTVPTGGGKTLASLRFAMRHAEIHGLDRIVYVLPYTSIIDQNAAVVRSILELPDKDAFGSVVLEHHSNLTPDRNLWRANILSENWDSPVVYTTSVQLLDTLFGGGTRAVRRFHQLARAVLVFDEIQTLPVRCVHLFCNAVNYLVEQCKSTVLLCTATQPLLGELKNRANGVLNIDSSCEIIPDVAKLFAALKRVEVIDQRKAGGWTAEEIAALATTEAGRSGGCLVIVNTKRAARAVYEACRNGDLLCYHLSTSMCPVHRMKVLALVKSFLGKKPVICVSTQLIEAGVDIDFGSVVRVVAGMDSIAQAAGRCNRNGYRPIGFTHVVNVNWEPISSLPDIKVGAADAQRVLDEFRRDPHTLGGDLLSPIVMRRYFEYYFHNRADIMTYPIKAEKLGREDTLLKLLSTNELSQGSPDVPTDLRHAFMTAGKLFQAIDAPTRGVIVPYGAEGREVISNLSAAFELPVQVELLRKAQRFTVNLFPHAMERLQEAGAIREVQEETGVLALDERFYSEEFGVSDEAVVGLDTYIA
jgi:CRISPR-associated endonuclease/helicase Cas3